MLAGKAIWKWKNLIETLICFRPVEEDAPVQGPLPYEPDDAPWKKAEESGIRKLLVASDIFNFHQLQFYGYVTVFGRYFPTAVRQAVFLSVVSPLSQRWLSQLLMNQYRCSDVTFVVMPHMPFNFDLSGNLQYVL